jgi:hypothetical protein
VEVIYILTQRNYTGEIMTIGRYEIAIHLGGSVAQTHHCKSKWFAIKKKENVAYTDRHITIGGLLLIVSKSHKNKHNP